jgi:hypothetical protein
MGIRCTVLGHDWGEVGVERDRQEDGDEVVVTVREVRTCSRCGDEEVLGESMEVTAIEPPDAEPEPEPAPPEADSADETPTHPAERGGDDADYGDPATDDGVILEEDAGEPDERGPGEWPDAPERDEVPEESEPWPDTATEDETPESDERFVGAGDVPDGDDAAGPSGGEILDGDDDTATQEPAPGEDHDAPDESADEGADLTDDDGIIEAGGGAGGVDDDDVGGVGGAPDGADDGADRVEVPDAEADQDDDAAPEADDGGDAATPPSDGAPETTGDAPDEEPAMGADATRRPEDDAEVLEATEPNEQSRATAEEPVDPEGGAAAGDHRVSSGRDEGPADPPAGDDGDASGPPGSLDPSEPPTDAEPSPEDVEYYCPECGFVDDSQWPSRRAGDVCPDCRRSYLADRGG